MNFENESWSQHLPDKSLSVCQDNLNELELSKIKLEPNSYYIVEYTEGAEDSEVF